VNYELPDVQAGFKKGRGIRDQISNICWIIEKGEKIPFGEKASGDRPSHIFLYLKHHLNSL